MFQQQLHFLTLNWSYKLELDLKTKTLYLLQSLFKAITVFLLTTGLCSQNKNVRLQSSNFSEKEKNLANAISVLQISVCILYSLQYSRQSSSRGFLENAMCEETDQGKNS